MPKVRQETIFIRESFLSKAHTHTMSLMRTTYIHDISSIEYTCHHNGWRLFIVFFGPNDSKWRLLWRIAQVFIVSTFDSRGTRWVFFLTTEYKKEKNADKQNELSLRTLYH